MTRDFKKFKWTIVNFLALSSYKNFVLLLMARQKGSIYSLIHFLQTAQSVTNTSLHNSPAIFMISKASGNTFGELTFAAFSTKNILLTSPGMISLFLIESSMLFPIKSTHLRIRTFFHHIIKSKTYYVTFVGLQDDVIPTPQITTSLDPVIPRQYRYWGWWRGRQYRCLYY